MPAKPLTSMPSAADFCGILSDARSCRVPGSWSGSAFRCHPCGIIRGTIKLTNEWHVNDYCSVQITDGDGWSRDYCTDPRAYGNPHPSPLNGKSITAWNGSRWESESVRAKIEPIVLAILNEAIACARMARVQQRLRERDEARRLTSEHEATVNAALQKVTI